MQASEWAKRFEQVLDRIASSRVCESPEMAPGSISPSTLVGIRTFHELHPHLADEPALAALRDGEVDRGELKNMIGQWADEVGRRLEWTLKKTSQFHDVMLHAVDMALNQDALRDIDGNDTPTRAR